ncbi:hypothetical protein ACKKBG_A32230 [Auxenochlorella protothecoides x Auxenochlorella symbiontica]
MQALAVVAASAQGTVGAVEEAPAPRPKRPASPTSSGDDSGRPSRKRVDLFPRIPRAARCGECENCLNPQRKKACSAARARLAAATQEGGGGGVTTAPAPSAAPAPPPPDQFITSLQTILAGSGGVVAERHATALTTLLSRAASLAHRSALLTVLQLSSDEVLAAVVRGGGVGPLERWLAEAVAGVKPRVVAKLLAALARMPVSLTVLRAGELGKSVGRLRKHPGFDAGVQAQAKALVASWKMMVDAAGGAAAETAARPMDRCESQRGFWIVSAWWVGARGGIQRIGSWKRWMERELGCNPMKPLNGIRGARRNPERHECRTRPRAWVSFDVCHDVLAKGEEQMEGRGDLHRLT